MQAQDISQLAQWLAATDIDYLELSSPEFHARIHRDGVTEVASGPAASEAEWVEDDVLDVLEVRAPSVGVLLDSIPGRAAPLCAAGEAVEAGRLLALLQVGSLLLPVRAPCAGRVGGWRVAPGSLVGYGTELLALHPDAASAAPEERI